MIGRKASPQRRSNAYNLFVFILTIFSLIIMVLLFMPLGQATLGLLRFYDNLICIFFLIDFLILLRKAPNKVEYFFHRGGWLDFLGSLPSVGVWYGLSGLWRLARLSRLMRIRRSLHGQGRKEFAENINQNRSAYTMFIAILTMIIILASASVLVLEFESQSPEASIITGWDALWYSIVTITTVGYGDYYPVTLWGRITAIFIMITGVGIIGTLASLLSNMLIGRSSEPAEEEPGTALEPDVRQELASIKDELAEMRQMLIKLAKDRDPNTGDR